MQLYVIARHGESTLNYENRINGDPSVPVRLTEKGRDEARLLGQQLAHIPLQLCLHSEFPRTRETAEIALAGREVPFLEEYGGGWHVPQGADPAERLDGALQADLRRAGEGASRMVRERHLWPVIGDELERILATAAA